MWGRGNEDTGREIKRGAFHFPSEYLPYPQPVTAPADAVKKGDAQGSTRGVCIQVITLVSCQTRTSEYMVASSPSACGLGLHQYTNALQQAEDE